MVIWLYGLSGSGKTTIARALASVLAERGSRNVVLDGDVLREGLNEDLGFSAQDRMENMRRTAHVARLFSRAGIVAIVSAITPYEKMRERARAIIGTEGLIEVFVDCHLEECERRDVKGLYKKARLGEIAAFTGVSDPFERPERTDLVVRTAEVSCEEAVERVAAAFAARRSEGHT
jgi:adenylyl-sulfate kinase